MDLLRFLVAIIGLVVMIRIRSNKIFILYFFLICILYTISYSYSFMSNNILQDVIMDNPKSTYYIFALPMGIVGIAADVMLILGLVKMFSARGNIKVAK